MKPVRILAKNPDIDIEIPMGDGPAVITGGLGGYEALERQDDISTTDWSGQEPLSQSVPLLLDGWSERESVEREWNTVKKLGRDPNGDENKPPAFKVFGPVEYPGKTWVLPSGGIEIDADSIIRRSTDGELWRIAFTLNLMEYIRPSVLKKRGRNRIGLSGNRALTHTVHKGETLTDIAVAEYGNWARWKEIGRKNSITDPNRVLPQGRVLKLP